MRMTYPRRGRLSTAWGATAALALAALLAAGNAQAADTASGPETAATKTGAAEPAVVKVVKPDPATILAGARTVQVIDAMRVVRDPESGELRAPTPAEGAAQFKSLEQMLVRSSKGLEEVQRDGTTVTIDLQGRFMSAEVMTQAPAGSEGAPQMTCVATTTEARAAEAGRQGGADDEQ